MRWLSPPDNVPEARDRVRYSSPTFCKKPSRSLISFRMRSAISLWLGVSSASMPENHCNASAIDRRATSLMLRPPILTASASGLSRAPSTNLAGPGALVAAEFFLDPGAVGLAKAPLHIRQDALERPVGRVFPEPVVVGHLDRLAVGAVEDGSPHLFRQVVPRRVHALPEVPGDAFERLRVILRRRMRPRADRALGEAAALVMDDEAGIEIELGAEPVAGRAGAERVVEREQPRLDLGDREARDRAGELRRKDRLLARIGVLGDRDAVGEVERGLERIGKPVAEIGRHDDAVDHHRDVVLQVLVERPDLVDLDHLAVDLDPLKAALFQVDELFAVLALAAARDRRQQVKPRPLRHRQYPVDHLRHGLADDRQSGRRRIGHADPRP